MRGRFSHAPGTKHCSTGDRKQKELIKFFVDESHYCDRAVGVNRLVSQRTVTVNRLVNQRTVTTAGHVTGGCTQ